MTKHILITGATGKQGGAVIDQLAKHPDFTLLAVTRNASGGGAEKLKSKGNNIKVLQGDLNDVPALFKAAKAAASGDIWGVYSVQTAQGQPGAKNQTSGGEVQQGTDMVDESVKAGVKHFVYSSVERGGDEHSWNNEVPTVEHFKTKHQIELHLRDNAGTMGWTILRPTAFMDNLTPGFAGKVFLAAMRDTLGSKPLQWIACKDIGVFARIAFEKPDQYNHKAIGLAGEEMTVQELASKIEKKTTTNLNPTYGVLGSLLKWVAPEMGAMINWFGTEGYKADIPALRKMHPGLLDFEAWLEKESTFPRRA